MLNHIIPVIIIIIELSAEIGSGYRIKPLNLVSGSTLKCGTE